MPRFEDFVVLPSTPLRQAMERMTRNARGLVLVCDRETHLVGILTDGDVRRAVLRGTLLAAPSSQWMNPDPISAASPQAASDLLRRHGALAVPVVDERGAVTALVLQSPNSTSRPTPRAAPEAAATRSSQAGHQVLRPESENGRGEAESGARAGPDAAPSTPRVVAVIPARGGSKRLPDKNLRPLGGRSLVARAVDTCLGARTVDRVLVSTDSEAIAVEARRAGGEVPWLRPAALATDRAPSLGVLRHALAWLVEREPGFEIALLVEPTAPLRTSESLDRAVEMLTADGEATSVVSVCRLPHTLHPDELLQVGDGGLRPFAAFPGPEHARPSTAPKGASPHGDPGLDRPGSRHEQSPVLVRNGWVYAVRVTTVLEEERLYGRRCLPLELPWEGFHDIDTAEDLRRAEDALRRQEGESLP